MMPKTEVTINRSPKRVWGYVTNKKKWKKWWGSSLKKVDPAWEEGATLVWKEGGSSTILRLIPEQVIQIFSGFLMTTFEFISLDVGSTLVVVDFSQAGGAQFSDGGAAYKAKLALSLGRLKQLVEAEREK